MDHGAEGVVVRRPRRDAQRNRAAILAAAGAVFAQRGCEVDVREIARWAGVGMGTLYRHFPTKDALLDTVLREDFLAWTRTARQSASEHADPWAALVAFLDDALTRQASHRAMLERFADSWDTVAAVDECRHEVHPVIDDLVARCHTAGSLRAGVSSEDVSLLLVALGRIVQLTPRDRPDLWRRLLTIMLDGLQARDGPTERKTCQVTVDVVRRRT